MLEKDAIRKALFTPCVSKEEMDRWIRVFLNIRLPDRIVSDESNTSPLDMIWQLYDRAVRNDMGTEEAPWKSVMAYANRFGGKCVEKGTLLRTPTQLKPIEDVRVGEVIWSGKAWRTVTDWIHDGVKDSATLELAYGQRLTGSHKHRVWAWSLNGFPDWKRIVDLTPEDLVAVDTTIPLGNIKQEEYEEGYLLGILQGDGCTRFIEDGHIAFTTDNEEILSFWKHSCVKYAGREPQQSSSRPYDYRINSVAFCKELLRMGLKKAYSWEKDIPSYVTSSTSRSLGFVAGIIDTDGTVLKTGKLQIHMTGKRLVEQLQVVMGSLGVEAQLLRKDNLVGKQKHAVWELNCSTTETLKLSKVLMCLGSKMSRAAEDDVGNWNTALAYNWQQVKSVSLGKADFYDLTVDTDHSYWSNGLISHNTLGSSILESMLLLHTDRNIVHMAAIVDQSKKAQEYVKGFFDREHLRDFKLGDNAKETVIVAYTNAKTGVPITESEFGKLKPSEQDGYVRKQNYSRIIACTMQSTNGQHSEILVADEIDVIEKKNLKAYAQAKGGIPTSRNGMTAMTLFVSTRKSRIGKVQEEINNAPKTKLRLIHWNIIDITEPCPPSRHLPEKEKQIYWINDADVSHISDTAHSNLSDSEKSKWYPKEGFAGCGKCPLFAACKGRLATEQKGHVGKFEDGGTALLIPISDLVSYFASASPEFITTEYMCRKPDTSGLVFPRLNDEMHYKSAAEIAEMVAGEPKPEIVTKEELIAYLVHNNVRFVSGMDFGFNHLFAVSLVGVWGNIAFVIDAIGKSQQELDDKLNLASGLGLKTLNATIFADPEDPASITTFKRKGFKMKEWSKGPGSVNAGIEIIRTKLFSKAFGPTLFFLKDPEIYPLFKAMKDYRFTIDKAGSFTETPDDENDDYVDATRYAIMNIFGKNGSLKENLALAPVSQAAREEHWTEKVKRMNAGAMSSLIGNLTGGQTKIKTAEETDEPQNPNKKGRKSGFYWDL